MVSANNFGLQVTVVVDAIARRPEETNIDDYYFRVKANPVLLTAKAADLADSTDPPRLEPLKPDERDQS